MTIALALSPAFSRPTPPWASRSRFGADFAEGRYMRAGRNVPADAAFAVSRASQKLAVDRAGHWHMLAAEAPAITDLGLSIEPQTTNENPNAANIGASPSATDTLDGLPTGWDRAKFDGSLTRGRIVDLDTWLGLPSLTIRLWGDADVGDAELRWFIWSNLATSLPIAQDERFLVSFFLKRIAGSNANVTTRMRMTERDSGGNYLVKQVHAFSPSPGPDRHAHSFSVASANAARAVLGLEFGFTGPFDITFRLAGVQIERTSETTPTSPILSAGTPATRQADVLMLKLEDTPLDLDVDYADGRRETLTDQAGVTQYGSDDLGRAPIRMIANQGRSTE